MKSIINVFIVFMFFSIASFAQWSQQFSGTGANLHKVYFVNENIGFIYGDAVTFRRTTNGGSTWSPITIPYSTYVDYLSSIQFINYTDGWLLTKMKNMNIMRLYKTTDGGQSWLNISDTPLYFVQQGTSIRDLIFLSETEGFIITWRSIYKTTDGGLNWTSHTIPTIPNGHLSLINSVTMFDMNTGYAVATEAEQIGIGYQLYGGLILITGDGGVSWNVMKSEPDLFLEKIKFNQLNEGLAIGWGIIPLSKLLKTTDNGLNWINVNLNDSGIRFPNDICYATDKLVFMVGEDINNLGFVAKSTDGGNNWTYKHFSQKLNSVNFLSEETGWTTGYTGFVLKYDKPVISLTSPNGGENWEVQSEQNVIWDYTSSLDSIKIQYSINGGSSCSP